MAAAAARTGPRVENGHAIGQYEEEPVLPRVTSKWINRVLFTGTGTSGQVPAAGCVLRSPTSTKDRCIACFDALNAGSKNRRGCTSAAIVGGRRDREKGLEESLILIDCGPTFYSSAMSYFAAQNLRQIDAVLLTHAHADAILGLDNLRSWTMGGIIQDRVHIYCTSECYETVRGMFPYLADPSRSTGGGGVGDVQFHIIDAQTPFRVPLLNGDSVEVTPLPAHHGRVQGKPFECLGFRIDSLSYLSDCHHVPPSTAQLMAGSQVVVLDALNPYRHASHFSLAQALSFTLSMPSPAPRLSLLTDLTHNLEHYETERNIQDWRKEMQAYKDMLLCSGKGIPSIDKVGQGEGGGPRWWAGKWEEGKSEKVMRNGLKMSLQSQSGFKRGEAEAKADAEAASVTAGWQREALPNIHVAWDGLVVNFSLEHEVEEGS